MNKIQVRISIYPRADGSFIVRITECLSGKVTWERTCDLSDVSLVEQAAWNRARRQGLEIVR